MNKSISIVFNLNPVIQNLFGSIDPNQAFNLPINSLER